MKEGLGDTRDHHADGQTEDLLVEPGAEARRQEHDAGDHDEVEHHRAQGRDKEMTAGVRHADEHGGQANQEHVGEHDAQEAEH